VAKQSGVDAALANIDKQIEDLQRARDIIALAAGPINPEVPADKPKRGRKRKAGLPAADQSNGE
jgi:hypothetical protein